jgi:TonB family protein
MVPAMNTATIRSDWVGHVVEGRFPLLQWLGGSESGGVFLTELQGQSQQKAVIKLIPANTEDAEAHIAGWAAAMTLAHPHLMRLFDSGRCQIDDAALLFVVTEYAEEVLSQILEGRPLTPAEASEMLDPVLDALSYLQGKGFVHGHLKPSNIMVVGDRLKLSLDSVQVMGQLGEHFPPAGVYDAPERATGAVSPAADVWSLGVTLVEALTQYPPVCDKSTKSKPVVPEFIPQPFAYIAQECLRQDPVRRCTLGQIKARLEPVRSHQGLPDTMRRTRFTRFPVTVLIGAVFVLIAVIAVLQLRSHRIWSSLQTENQRSLPNITVVPPKSPVVGTQTVQGSVVTGAVVERVLPNIPEKASLSIQGKIKVKVRVTIDSSGKVSDAALESPGPSKYFANQALQAAWNWRFKPAQVDSKAVSSVWLLQFQFTQTATDVTPVETSP